MDVILQEAEKILSPHLEAVSAKNAGRIWGFMSKFVMLDRFSKVLGAADTHPGLPIPRRTCLPDYLGTGAKVCISLEVHNSFNSTFRSLTSLTHQRK